MAQFRKKIEKFLTENFHCQTFSRSWNRVANNFLFRDHFRLLELKMGYFFVKMAKYDRFDESTKGVYHSGTNRTFFEAIIQ